MDINHDILHLRLLQPHPSPLCIYTYMAVSHNPGALDTLT